MATGRGVTAAEIRPTVSAPVPAAAAAVPVRVRRRKGLLLGSAGSVLLGAVAAVWLFTSATDRVEVVAVRDTVTRGATITAEDLVVVRLGVDPAVPAVLARDAETLVGKRAAVDIAAGGLVTRSSVTDALVPGKGLTVVGLALGKGMLPSVPLKNGDAVRIVQAPGTAPAAGVGESAPVTTPATVVAVARAADNQSTLVDVLVAEGAAPELAARALAGKVAVVLDSRER